MMRDLDALFALLVQLQHSPFAWGTNDCVTFASACIKAQTGRLPLAGVGRWKGERGALRMLARRGGLEAAVSAVLTCVGPALAARGDVALVATPMPSLMVVEGDALVAPGETGLIRLPRAHMLKAWSAVHG